MPTTPTELRRINKARKPTHTVRKQLLLAVGYSQEKIDAMKLDKFSDEQMKQKLKERLFTATETDIQPQQPLQISGVEAHVDNDWGSFAQVDYKVTFKLNG